MRFFIFQIISCLLIIFPLPQLRATDSQAAFEIFCKGIHEYILPDDHPAKSTLDQIFSDSKVLSSISEMKKAGFINPVVRKKRIVIGKHPNLSGYLLKMYLDNHSINELSKFTRRIKGSLFIQKNIDSYGYNHLLKVPKKWIYQIPSSSSTVKGNDIYPKKFILVVEDMDLVSNSQNANWYKHLITTEQLDALFKILIKCGLKDSTHILNIPFSSDGKIAFIDTEITGKDIEVWFKIAILFNFLSHENQQHWRELMKEGI